MLVFIGQRNLTTHHKIAKFANNRRPEFKSQICCDSLASIELLILKLLWLRKYLEDSMMLKYPLNLALSSQL